MELIVLLSIAGLSFIAGNLIGYNQGAKKMDELYRKYQK